MLLLLCARSLAASYIIFLGFARLQTSHLPYIPWVPIATLPAIRLVLPLTEVIGGYYIALMPTEQRFILWVIVCTSMVCVSTVGIVNIRISGHCGCGASQAPQTLRLFIVRNCLLTISLSVGILIGPSLRMLSDTKGNCLLVLGVMPGIYMLFQLLWATFRNVILTATKRKRI